MLRNRCAKFHDRGTRTPPDAGEMVFGAEKRSEYIVMLHIFVFWANISTFILSLSAFEWRFCSEQCAFRSPESEPNKFESILSAL